MSAKLAQCWNVLSGRRPSAAGLRMVVGLFLTLTLLCSAGDNATKLPAEIYVLGGQSNMRGLGDLRRLAPEQLQPLTHVFLWHDGRFQPYDPGQRAKEDKSFGPELGFAQELARHRPDRRIYLIKYAVGGMPLHPGWNGGQWQGETRDAGRTNFFPGATASDAAAGVLYFNLRNTARAAIASLQAQGVEGAIRGFIWMQGEQDSKNEISARDYPQMLRLLRDRLAEDLNVERLPLFYGQVLPYTPALERFTHRELIRARMAAADSRSGKPEAIKDAFMVSTDAIPVGSDRVHYTSEGQLKLGNAFATAVLDFAKRPQAAP